MLCCHANFSTNHVRSSERQYRDIGANVLIWFEPVIQSKAYILAAVNFIKPGAHAPDKTHDLDGL